MIRKKEKILEKIFFNQIAYFVIGFFVIILIAFPLSRKITRQYGLNKEISELNAELAGLEGKNNVFKQMIGYLESDQFAEEEARLSLNLKKEGEEVVVIKDAAGRNPTDSAERDDPVPMAHSAKVQNPFKWWVHFFN
jgi:cell division protein FtsB